MTLLAYKYRIYPNERQKEYFAKCFGCCRFVYNKLLEEKIKNYEDYKKEKEDLLKKYKTINNDNKNNTKLDIYNNISEEQIKKLIKVKKINEITYYKNQEQYSFLKEVDSLALCNAKINLETAFENFYRRCSKLKIVRVINQIVVILIILLVIQNSKVKVINNLIIQTM